jgi:hypothetical protein
LNAVSTLYISTNTGTLNEERGTPDDCTHQILAESEVKVVFYRLPHGHKRDITDHRFRLPYHEVMALQSKMSINWQVANEKYGITYTIGADIYFREMRVLEVQEMLEGDQI